MSSNVPSTSTGTSGQPSTQKKKESIVDLSKYMNQNVRVKFQAGREVTGILKGYDKLLCLVLDETIEYMRDPDDPFKTTDETRELGLVVCKGAGIVVISPVDGSEQIANPFLQE